jgi:protein-tyrosine phosphatase
MVLPAFWFIFMMASAFGLTMCLIILGLHYSKEEPAASGSVATPTHEELNVLSLITPGVFVTSLKTAQDAAKMKSHSISHVLSVAGDYQRIPGVEYLCLTLPGSGDVSGNFDKCATFIAGAVNGGRKVVVHCQHGQSRSVAMVLAYLIKEKQMSQSDAFALVSHVIDWCWRHAFVVCSLFFAEFPACFLLNQARKQRPVIEVRAEFLQQLQTYAKSQ